MPLDTWKLVETGFDVRHNLRYEALLALGSGPLQQRAAFEEGLRHDPQDVEFLRLPAQPAAERAPQFRSRIGTFMPGVTGPHPTCGDELINLPALHGLIIYCTGERLDMQHCVIRDYRRWLDLRTGHLHRELVWHARSGAALRVHFERFISARRRHVMALRCTVAHLEGRPAELRFVGALSAEVRTNGFDHFTSVDITGEHSPITLAVQTNSGIEVSSAALLACERPVAWSIETEPRWIAIAGTWTLDPGESVRVSKFAAMTSSRHVTNSPLDAARKVAWDAAGSGFDRLAAESDAVWQERWDQTDVVIEGDEQSQLALRLSLYHLLRAVVEDDARYGLDPHAATAEAHCGRPTWAQDIFALPAFLYTRPQVGKTLAEFRVLTLPGARRNAQRGGYSGARYAWESSPTGDEQCPLWVLADQAMHVTADVAYGLWHAHLANPGDHRFLFDIAEVLLEAARYWTERVTHDPTHDAYELSGVMGPNQYAPFSRNNAYTNRLVAFALRLAVEAWQKAERIDAATASELGERLGLQPAELARFAEIAAKLRMPYDAPRQLVLQSEDFFGRAPFDIERWWPDRSRSLSDSTPHERLYRSQVLQRADVLQLIALFPQEVGAQQMRAAFDAYVPLTAHDSAESLAVHALVAALMGDSEKAFGLWQRSIERFLNVATADAGLSTAQAAAHWQAAIFGFAGLRTRMQSETLYLDPYLPAAWTALRFPLVWDGQPLHVTIQPDQIVIDHRGERSLTALIAGQAHELTPGQQHVIQRS